MPSIFSTIFSAVLRYNKQRTNDVVGAYPERLHVRALPERRYLKTSRVMAMIAFVSIAFNFGFAFVYMKMASYVSSVIAQPLPENPTAEQLERDEDLALLRALEYDEDAETMITSINAPKIEEAVKEAKAQTKLMEQVNKNANNLKLKELKGRAQKLDKQCLNGGITGTFNFKNVTME